MPDQLATARTNLLQMRPRKRAVDDPFTTGAAELSRRGGEADASGTGPDSEESRRELRRLLEWFYFEKDRQAANRLDMAIDHDFYDGMQWRPDDEAVLTERRQSPLVYNEVAPMCDWLIGTERRTRVDWKAMPRSEDDVDLADTKTKVLKFVSDINRVPFARSRAFADAVKGGVGWVDDGTRDDPTQDVLYSRYEDWRNVLHDASGYELDLSDARYVFRWRWVDEDIAMTMFPSRAAQIRRAVEDSAYRMVDSMEEADWQVSRGESELVRSSGFIYAQGYGSPFAVDAKRRRVRLIECQYRKPAKVQIVDDGPWRGAIASPFDRTLASHVRGTTIVEKVMLRTHVAIFTEADMLAMGPSIYRHNRFSLTPIWCYRRGRDRLPYGVVRRVRSIQEDINKRASKALFLLNTNQIIADEGAVTDWNEARDEADRPDGTIIKKAGKEFEIRRDLQQATGQMEMMTLGAQSIQKSAGVSNENLGRQTNAVSGEAIKARQLQGSVVTTEPFDNLRLAVQVQGEKQLSAIEQFYTQEKVVRLTGTRGALDWVKINVPEVQPDGSVRFINDITASAADFVVSEQDYAGTLRQVMFESLNQLATRLPPEVGMRLLTVAMEYSDLPNKDEVAEAIRRMTGDPDPNKRLTPEEQQQAEINKRAQAEALEIQRQTALAALDEQRAKVREINARAAKIEAEASGAVDGDAGQVRAAAAAEIDRLSEELRAAQAKLLNETAKIQAGADSAAEVARINAAAKREIAELQQASDEKLAPIIERLNEIERQMKGRDRMRQEKKPR
jgi:hypothetical protein